jgi:hypothetical protein
MTPFALLVWKGRIGGGDDSVARRVADAVVADGLRLCEPRLYRALDADVVHAYCAPGPPRAGPGHAIALTLVRDIAGASAGAPTPYHYVVETDAAAGTAEELARWYDTEHLAGLAAVPGCARARRFAGGADGPASYACYDLTDPAVLGSPAWLAVRATPWSGRVRPHFRNTVRTMFRAVPAAT